MSLIGRLGVSERTTLESYLAKKRVTFAKASGDRIGEEEVERLRYDIEHLTDRITDFFIDSEDLVDSHLVLGKIQSGKTAHMLGVIASLVDTSCSLVVLISGVTGQLNRQTSLRLSKDLSMLPGHSVVIQGVPTARELDRDPEMLESVSRLVERRIATADAPSREHSNLPVLATLETGPRIDALAEIIAKLHERHGDEFKVVLIDDEADQASQNTGEQSGTESVIYGLLRGVRESGVRNCLLSYTATPQAVLLASRDGVLRPRLCSVISPGSQYFGIDDVCSDAFAPRLMEIADVPTRSQLEPPQSLREAMLDFFLLGVIQRMAPEVFYSSDSRIDFSEMPISEDKFSLQMVVHPSAQRTDHTKYFSWVQSIKRDLEDEYSRLLDGDETNFLNDTLQPAYRRLIRRCGVERRGLPTELSTGWINDFFDVLLGSTQLLVVNADPNRASGETEMPHDDDDGWHTRRMWVLVGGDILGRGVTIPTLVSTYFTRQPRTANFDTLSQQMRFCGYRSRYSEFVQIYAPSSVIDNFRSASVTDRVLFNYARSWDEADLNLFRSRPEVVYAQRERAGIRPTRPAVMDTRIDRSVLGQNLFESKHILMPIVAVENSRLVAEFLSAVGAPSGVAVTDWSIWADSAGDVRALLSRWTCQERDRASLTAAQIAFDPELDEVGLGRLPLVLAVRDTEMIIRLSTSKTSAELLADVNIGSLAFRSLQAELRTEFNDRTAERRFDEWKKNYDNPIGDCAPWMANARFTYIGGSQRAIRDEVNLRFGESVVMTIEPIAVRPDPKSEKCLGVGVAISILAPADFSLTRWSVPQ